MIQSMVVKQESEVKEVLTRAVITSECEVGALNTMRLRVHITDDDGGPVIEFKNLMSLVSFFHSIIELANFQVATVKKIGEEVAKINS